MASSKNINRRAFLALSGAAAVAVPTTALADEASADDADGAEAPATDDGSADDPLAELSENPVTQETGLGLLVICDPAVALGGTENIVVIGDEAFGTLVGGALVVENLDTQVVQTLEAQDVVDSAALMTLDFATEDQLGSWGVTKVVMYWGGGNVTEHTVSSEEASQHFVFAAAAAEKEESENSTAQDPAFVASDEDGVDAVTYDTLGEAAEAGDTAVENAQNQVNYVKGSVRMVPMALATADEGAVTQTANLKNCIAIDPGHGGNDSGAIYPTGSDNPTHRERDMTWTIGQYCIARLKEHGIPYYLTVTQSEFKNTSLAAISIKDRVTRAVTNNAKAVVSLHINSASASSANGVEVLVPYNCTFHPEVYSEGQAIGQKILDKLTALRLKSRGLKTSQITDDDSYDYSNGADGDYYGIIRYARQNGITGIIVEHGFITNASDRAFLSQDSNLKALGYADAEAIAAQWPELSSAATPIMGNSSTTREQMAQWFAATCPSNWRGSTKDTKGYANAEAFVKALYGSKGVSSLKEFAYVVWDQAVSEGVRPEVLLGQVIQETGWLSFGNDVRPAQCNFGGIGATGNGEPGNSFDTVAIGLLAQSQHLKGYATDAALNNICVDPRYKYISPLGKANNSVEGLAGTWASDENYATRIKAYMQMILAGANAINVDTNTYVTIADGTLCTIASALNTSRVLDVAGGRTTSGTSVQLYDANSQLHQRFRIVSNGDGTYRIVNCKSGLVLDVAGGKPVSGKNVQQYTWNGGNNQRWKFVAQGGGYKIVSAMDYHLVLDLAGARSANGTNVQIYTDNGGNNQTFALNTMSQPVANGTYRVSTALNGSVVLDIASASTADQANVQLYSSTGGTYQQFKFEYQAQTGCYRITNVKSGKVLDVAGARSAASTNVQQYTWHGGLGQLWTLEKQSDGSFVIRSATGTCVLDAAGGRTANGTNVQIYTANGGANQGWNLAAV